MNLYTFASDWCLRQQSYFTVEDMKTAFFRAGGIAPKNPNSFGGLFQSLKHEGVILKRGHAAAKYPLAKGRILTVWVSARTYQTKRDNRKTNGHAQPELFAS